MGRANLKGQASLFIIMGLLVLFAAIGLFYLTSLQSSTNIETTNELLVPPRTEYKAVVRHLDTCFTEHIETSLSLLALSGGTFAIYEDGISPLVIVPSYRHEDNPLYIDAHRLETVHVWEERTSRVVESRIPDCLQGLEHLQIDAGTPDVVMRSTENKVITAIHYPLTLHDGDSSSLLSDFTISVPVRLQKIHDAVGKIVTHHAQEPEWIPESMLMEMDLAISYVTTDTDVHYQIADPHSPVDGGYLTFLLTLPLHHPSFDHDSSLMDGLGEKR